MYDNKELKRSSESLYNDIDACISDIIKARLQKDDEAEGRAIFIMESLMVATLQQLSCIIDHLEEEEQEPDIENDLDDYLEIAHDILEKAFDEEQGYQTDDGVSEHQTAIKAVKDAMKEQKPLSSEETELNSIAFLEQIGYTCIPPGKEQKPEIKYVYPIFKVGDTIKPKAYNESHRINEIKDDNYVLDNGFTFPIVDQDVWEIVKPKPGEWSEEDQTIIDCAVEIVEKAKLPSLAASLKSLRPQSKAKQQPAEWNEEDKKCIQSIISCLKYLETQDTERRWNGDHNAHPEQYAELITKLQSIFSRSNWKPSEEQMEALDNARFCKSYDRSELDSLYTELKKQYDRH